ncbi:MAG: hypothetical protein U0401_10175 [Anaerolineae bacterium]
MVNHSLGAMIAFELGRKPPGTSRWGGDDVGPVPRPTAVLPSPAATQLLLNRQGEPGELARRGIVVCTAPGFESRRPDLVDALVQIALHRTQPPAIFLRQLGASPSLSSNRQVGTSRRFNRPCASFTAKRLGHLLPQRRTHPESKSPGPTSHLIASRASPCRAAGYLD